MNLIYATIALGPLFLLGACTQQTVLYTEEKMGFSEAWGGAGETGGDLREKFAPKEQLAEARNSLSDAIAGNSSADVQRPAFANKRYESQQFDGRKNFSQGNKTSGAQNQAFSGIRDFGRKAFDSGNPAREGGAVAPWAGQKSNLPSTFATNAWTGSPGKFARPANRDSRKLLPFFGGRAANETRVQTVIPEGTIEPNNTRDGQRKSSMSVDEVRKLLHPGEYADS